MSEKSQQRALASSLSRTGSSLLKTVRVSVNWLFTDELGYTSMGNANSCSVHVAWYNDVFDGLSEAECNVLRTGVFAHEMLHQLLTNFRYTNELTKKMSRAEAGIFMQFANTIEDPAIEYFAPQCFGGYLLDALRFSIKHIYKISPGIEKSPNPFGQLINALINFGDMGLVKGEWTYPEAKEYFKKVAPVYNEAIQCPDSKKRLEYAKECMELTRPLWEELVKKQEFFEMLMEQLADFLKQSGIHLMDDSELDPGSESSSSSAPAQKRAGVIKKIMEKSDEDGDSSSEESEDGQDSSDLGSASDDLSSLHDKEGDKEMDKNGSKSKKSGGNSKNEPGKSDEQKESSSSEGSDPADDATADSSDANDIADEAYEVSDDVLDSIEQNIKDEEARLEKADKSSTPSEDKIEDFDITSKNFRGNGRATCINRKVSDLSSAGRMSGLYNEALSTYSYDIKNLTKTLDKLFKADRESTVAATSGEYNIIRGSLGTTARIFDKRRDPDKLKDAAVVLLIDLSGSMSGSKVVQARKTAICLAEALTACRIPYYVMGFHADMGADAVHDHFVTWANKKSDRESLISMDAHGNNFDGYSIRYAGEVLKKRQEDNKILFVISDGQPACSKYSSSAGIQDTIDAIKGVRKFSTCFGIAVGRSCGPELLQSMYGKDFIFVEDERLLSNMLCKKLTKVLSKKKG